MLSALHRLSVRHKLSVIVLAALGLGLLLAGIALVAYDAQRQARSARLDLVAQADTIGLASTGALSFNDARGAAENLRVLRANPSVVGAALYAADGSTVAIYGVDPDMKRKAQDAPASNLDFDTITVARPVVLEREPIGSIVLRARHNLFARALEHIGALFVIMALSMAAAFLLANRLQGVVVDPLQELAEVARRIREGDYALRATRRNDDEVGEVVDAFNALMDELARRARVLEEANVALRDVEEQLRGANRAKDQFLATLAHELRNPLAPIRTGIEILRLRREGPVAEKAIGTIQRQLTHMVRLIDDLMDISRISTGKIRLDLQRVTLAGALDAAVELSRPAIEGSRHTLETHYAAEPIELEADHTRLAQCVGNLLNNAAKYTPPGGRIVLSARREGASTAVIEVADNGLGIPPALLEQVFTMFAQVDKTLERAQGGLGIGLSLVRTLVQLHGGSVAAASEGPDRGSTFTIRIPCLPVSAVAAHAGPSAGAEASGGVARRILVVDDNVDAARTLQQVLEIVGHAVDVAHHGGDAIAHAVSHRPDVVLLDIGLPGMSGYDVARLFRADPRFAGVMLVALTGWGAESDRQRARDAGFDAHLTKPVAIDDLFRVLAQGKALEPLA